MEVAARAYPRRAGQSAELLSRVLVGCFTQTKTRFRAEGFVAGRGGIATRRTRSSS